MKDRVVFETNVPVTAALAYPDGIKVEGRFGDQVMYSLSDERVMYVPPVVRGKLVEIGIQQHEPFSICKAERRNGNRRFIEWVVKRLESEQHGVRKPGNGDESRPVEVSPSTDTAASCVAGIGSNGKPNGKVVDVRNGSKTPGASLHTALLLSIDAAIAAEHYASAKGLSVRFGSEDLRAMALSLFIQHARDGGVR
jgi:hypothetical protein